MIFAHNCRLSRLWVNWGTSIYFFSLFRYLMLTFTTDVSREAFSVTLCVITASFDSEPGKPPCSYCCRCDCVGYNSDKNVENVPNSHEM